MSRVSPRVLVNLFSKTWIGKPGEVFTRSTRPAVARVGQGYLQSTSAPNLPACREFHHSTRRSMADQTTSSEAVPDIEDFLQEWESNVREDSLSDSSKAIHKRHLLAIKNHADTYIDPDTDFVVFSMLTHLRRGYCCGNACRHCPYLQVNVDSKYKELKKFNSAFYG